MEAKVGMRTDVGRFREHNEDRLFADAEQGIFIVADGMGGQAAGEQASQMAVDIIPRSLFDKIDAADLNSKKARPKIIAAIKGAVLQANEEVVALANLEEAFDSMGTTVVLAFLHEDTMYVAGLGDSRVYIFRGESMAQLTKDHSLANALIEAGTLNENDAREHRFRNVLWKFLGSQQVGDGPDVKIVPIKSGDRFLLCSDGLTGVVDDATLFDYVTKYDDLNQCAFDLIELALDNGSKDNVTAMVVALS